MDNDQKLNSTETITSNTKFKKFLNPKVLIILAIVIALIIFIFLNCFTRNAKNTVKNFIKAMDNGNEKDFINLIDYEGHEILSTCSEYKDGEYIYNFEKFETLYKEQKENIKHMDKDTKGKYNKNKNDDIKNLASSYLDTNNLYEFKLEAIKTEKVAKNITKVTTEIQKKDNNEKTSTNTYVYYTIKKRT